MRASHRGLAALALLIPSLAAAQEASLGFDAHGFSHAPDDGDLHDFRITWRSEAQIPGSIGFSGLLEFADRPLVLVEEEGDERVTSVLADDLLVFNLGVHASVHERVAVAASLPILLYSRDSEGGNGPGLADIRLHAPIRLAHLDVGGEDSDGIGLSIVPFFTLPTGAASRFLGSTAPSGGLVAAASWGLGPLIVAGNLGAAYGRPLDYENLNGGVRLATALGLGYAFGETLAAHAEMRLDPTLNSSEFSLSESPAELIATVRGRHAKRGLSWNAGGATGITRGVSAARFRLFAGAGFIWGKDGPPDTDKDGFVDRLDGCPKEAETANGFEDDDGCPDALSSLRVTVRNPDGKVISGATVTLKGKEPGKTDPDGRIVFSELEPGKKAEIDVSTPPETRFETGHATVDSIVAGPQEKTVDLVWKDGAVDLKVTSTDRTPIDASVTLTGPTPRDPFQVGADGAEHLLLGPGSWSFLFEARTPEVEYGTQHRRIDVREGDHQLVRLDVVMEPHAVEVTEEEVIILEAIHFDYDSAKIKPESIKIVDEVAANLIGHPSITKVEVQGHTDSDGDDTYNLDLSQKRVEAVVAALVERGVAAERLVAKGYGEAKPLQPNTTDENKAKNRRVQFIILEPAPEGETGPEKGKPSRMERPPG